MAKDDMFAIPEQKEEDSESEYQFMKESVSKKMRVRSRSFGTDSSFFQ